MERSVNRKLLYIASVLTFVYAGGHVLAALQGKRFGVPTAAQCELTDFRYQQPATAAVVYGLCAVVFVIFAVVAYNALGDPKYGKRYAALGNAYYAFVALVPLCLLMSYRMGAMTCVQAAHDAGVIAWLLVIAQTVAALIAAYGTFTAARNAETP